MSPTRLLVTGSREWKDVWRLEEVLMRHYSNMVEYAEELPVLVHGDCPKGADYLADKWAVRVGVSVERHPADWDRYGNSAGFKRNALMVNLGATLCVAFLTPGCKGTVHCAALAQAAGIPVVGVFAS